MRPLLLSVLVLAGTTGTLQGAAADPSPSEINDIIQKFAANEAAFAKAREVYTYRQSARIQEMDPGGGKWEQVSDIIFSPEGKRTERVVRAPVTTLRNITMTPEDLKDMSDVQPFVLTTSELPKYFIQYLGRQTVDEIGCYVFSVKPRKLEGKERYFVGQVWVDDRDLQIVKSYGRAWGLANSQGKNASPKFETFREQIDGKYWFPTYTLVDDTLHFKTGDVHVRQVVKYTNYKRFGSNIKITYEGQDIGNQDGSQQPQQQGTPSPKPQ